MLKYTGELYARMGRRHCPTGKTGADWDALEAKNAELRKQADYAHRLICDWWKPETTSQAVHREYALSALANRQISQSAEHKEH